MKNVEIIKILKRDSERGDRIRAGVMKTFKSDYPYEVSVMKSYSGDSGLGYMGATCIMEIRFKSKSSAEKLENEINSVFSVK